MTPRQLQSLIQRVAVRAATCGVELSPDARAVLLGLLAYLSQGRDIPSQAAMALDIGIEERRVSRALGELAEPAPGAAFVEIKARGGHPSEYVFDLPRVDSWSRRKLALVPNPHQRWYQNGGSQEVGWYQNGGSPRARAPLASSTTTSTASSPASISMATLRAAKARIGSYGVIMPFGLLPLVGEYMVRGATEDDLASAAMATAAAGSNRWNLMSIILDQRGFGPPVEATNDDQSIISIDDYRAGGAK